MKAGLLYAWWTSYSPTPTTDDRPPLEGTLPTYLRALATLPSVDIHLGRFTTRPVRLPRANRRRGQSSTVEVLRTEEKGSDVNLATHLLFDAFKRRCDTAIVVSNDSDLTEAIHIAQSELGIRVGIVNPHPRSRRSRSLLQLGCSFYKQVPRRLLPKAQLPNVVHDAKGPIHKPDNWQKARKLAETGLPLDGLSLNHRSS